MRFHLFFHPLWDESRQFWHRYIYVPLFLFQFNLFFIFPFFTKVILCLLLRLLAPFYLFHQCTKFSFLRALFPGRHFWPHQLLCAHQSLSSLPSSTVFNYLRCHSLGHTSLPLPPGQPSSQGKGDAWDLMFFPPWVPQQSRLCSSPEHRTHFMLTTLGCLLSWPLCGKPWPCTWSGNAPRYSFLSSHVCWLGS